MDLVRELLRRDTPVKWLFYGDSITHGTSHTFGWRDYVELFSERVRAELGRSMDIVINSAISGHTTRQLLEGYSWRVEQFRPDVVFLMIGMNDCKDELEMSIEEFQGNLVQLYQQNAALGALTVFQTTCPIIPGLAPEREPDFLRHSCRPYAMLPAPRRRRWWTTSNTGSSRKKVTNSG